MNQREKSLIFVHLAVFLFGFPGVISRLVNLPSFSLTFWRVALASLTLALILKLQAEKIPCPLPLPDSWLILATGLLLAFHWTAFFQSIQVSTVATGLLSYSAFPIFTIFLEPWLLGTRFQRLNLLLAVICFSGLYLLVPEFNFRNTIFIGVIWGLASGLSFALLTIINRKLSRHYSSLILAFYQDGLAMFFLLPVFLVKKFSWPGNLQSWGLILFLGIFCTALAHTFFIRGLKDIEAQVSSLISLLEPVYGLILAYLILKEKPDVRTLAGGGFILASVLWLSWQSAREAKKAELSRR
ncbi:MAG: EamA family transporter [Candidatus Saccharicenans sp.]|jgi:drug/metabolite transporter (DMT)-like permease|nr:EamA family transporter [Candidatus Saccharicenans sp.]